MEVGDIIKVEDSLLTLKGVGEKKYKLLNNLGLRQVKDIILNYPRTYIDRSKIYMLRDLNDKDMGTFKLTVYSKETTMKGKGRKVLKLKCYDENRDNCDVIFFNAGFLEKKLVENGTYYFYGQLGVKFNTRTIMHPEFTEIDLKDEKFLRIEPVYNLTAGLTNRDLIGISEQVILKHDFYDDMPLDMRQRNKLCDFNYAIKNIHFPKGRKELKIAKYRLVFEELFNLTIGLMLLKTDDKVESGVAVEDNSIDSFIEGLPFKLSSGQEKVWREIRNDLISTKKMNRLVQGDVGSGKTVIAMMGIYMSKLSGYQSALMAPTEILANQHYISFKEAFREYEINIELLTGSTKNKVEVLQRLANGEIDVLIGTHALLEDNVEFANIGLIITDEQHRFGVRQRNKLSSKGENPNVLIMSATPIPRTLSLVIYGDVDISVIDALPKGRKEIKTHYISKSKINDMYGFIRKEISEGRQAYFVCPLVEDSETLDLNSATSLYDKLSNVIYPEYKVGLVYGKMKSKDKDLIMDAFASGEIDILVSTTVIEVGINVPNSSIMVIKDSNRFGLAQLHQLRGRVGRGEYQSYCFLLADNPGKVAKERIEAMVDSNDGFKIAELDLKLRGPGELLGLRQHGIPELRVADIVKHQDILSVVQKEAKDLIDTYRSADGGLSNEYVKCIKERLFKEFTI